MAGAMEDSITIDNFKTKLAKLDAGTKPLFGLVDMGSNGIRFSISDLSDPGSRLLNCVYRERVGISLYDALHEKNAGSTPGYFSPELIQTVAQTLARFRYICDQYSVPMNQINVFATEATRTSKNKDQLLDAINKSSGLKVEILSKEMESMFGAMGARSGFTHVNGLFMDLGGGSVQMTYVNSKVEGYDLNAARFAVSMPYGAARLSEAIKSKSDAPEIIEELQTTMKKTFSGMMSNFAPLKAQVESKEGVSIYFCGGGFRGYGSMLMHTHEIQPYPIPAIGGFKVPGERFIRYKEMIKANDGKEKVFGMSKRRREQFRAIAAVVKALVGSIPNIKEVVFCSGGNREGVLFMKLPPNIREGNPLVLLPGYASQRNPLQFLDMIGSIINQGIPNECPPIFSNELRHYINRNIWIDMGNPDDANSAEALHDPISGEIAGLPGLTHEIRAVLALTLCSRWGADLGPTDQELYKRLQSLVGQKLSFWCEYIGTLVRLLATIFPAYPADMNFMKESIQFKAVVSETLGKHDDKQGVKLTIHLDSKAKIGLDLDDVLALFNDVGRKLDPEMKVKAKFAS